MIAALFAWVMTAEKSIAAAITSHPRQALHLIVAAGALAGAVVLSRVARRSR
jgi:hypothetical protein